MRRCAPALIVLLSMADIGAHADHRKPFTVWLQNNLYVARINLRGLFGAAVREKIESGLTTRIVLKASVVDAESSSVKSFSVTEYRIRYRVWEEDYVVRRWNALGESTVKLRRYGDVLRRIARVTDVPLAGRDDLVPGRTYGARVRVQVDPVSEALLARVREYLSNPGGHRREGGTRGLFGNLARIFFNPKMDTSGDARLYRSKPFLAVARSK